MDDLPKIADCVFGPTYAGSPNCRTNSGNSGFDKDYAAPGSVLEIPGSTDLLMIYHGEDQTCGANKTTVGIGMARSSDDGLTWHKIGQIISGQNLSKKCQRFIGAGVPNAIFMPDGYLYVYYVDWSGQGIDEIHVARVSSANLDSPSAWKKFNAATGWTGQGLNGSSTAVIHRAELGDQTVYASLPHVSYNTKLHRYLALWTSRSGFYTASSTDGLNWAETKQIWAFPEGSADECGHGNTIWYSYASLLSPSEASQQVSSDNGYLYYARGECNQPHQMVRRSFHISIP